MLVTCRLLLSWSFMCIPRNLTDEATSTTLFPIQNCFACLITFLNDNGFKFVSVNKHFLFRKPFNWDSAINISTNNVTDIANDDNILSSTNLCTDAFLMQKKKSSKNPLNNIGPITEPCGTLEMMSLKSLQRLLTGTHCLQFSNTCKYIPEHCH